MSGIFLHIAEFTLPSKITPEKIGYLSIIYHKRYLELGTGLVNKIDKKSPATNRCFTEQHKRMKRLMKLTENAVCKYVSCKHEASRD